VRGVTGKKRRRRRAKAIFIEGRRTPRMTLTMLIRYFSYHCDWSMSSIELTLDGIKLTSGLVGI